jgi:uncharacterized protein YbaA (DUF1428 family)
MHCKNPLCFEDSCNGECEAGEERVWPWYRYESKQEAQAETEKEKSDGLSETKTFC